ncbi:helix-turn-helix transcriptional regulator [Mucilaginibacter sp. PAMB04274]|uniref:helix-turn-helix domain-containing protein n=1 Tax=Mucilaginibacter sp. PAMB04274 TaxID=3138568 RepID=UPI0031F6F504
MTPSIGKKIKALRKQRGWPIRLIAAQLDISIPAYSKIETGYTDVNISRLEQIAKIFELSLVSLFTDCATTSTSSEEVSIVYEKLRTKQLEIIDLQKQLIKIHDEIRAFSAST